MKRVLMVSPHFPPDPGAATHRVRLLAPHLPRYGWEPVVLTIRPEYYESRLDNELADMVPPWLRVVRTHALPVRWTRRLGIGDLGLRAMKGLYRESKRLLGSEAFDAYFVTVFPMYPALLGPLIKRKFNLPFVLDYIDPWVGAWGQSVGPGANGQPNLKSQLSRLVGEGLEPVAVRAADGITAVSAATYEQIFKRYPEIADIPCAEIPYGAEANDFAHLTRNPRRNPYFDPNDGRCHMVYVGTLLPLGFETLRAVFEAVVRLRARRPGLVEKLRLHFFGTSNQSHPTAAGRVMPVAQEFGLEGVVAEIAPRVNYLDALTVQVQASAILLMGSSERHYTASKLFPALLARRPIIAAYHEESTVSTMLRQVSREPTVRVVTYNDTERAQTKVDELTRHLEAVIQESAYNATDVDLSSTAEYSAEVLAGRLADVMDRAALEHARKRSVAHPQVSRRLDGEFRAT